MRGLPPVPAEVALLELFYAVDGQPATTWHWVYDFDLQVLSPAQFEELWNTIVLAILTPVTSLMASAGSLARVRLRRFGSDPLDYLDAVAPNSGANGGCQVLMAASGVHWGTQFAGRGGQAFTRWPAFPDAWTDDHVHLNDLGWSEVGARSKDFRNAINTAVDHYGTPLRLVTLHRQAGGVPLAVAEPREIVSVAPVPRVAAVVRRARGVRSI